MKNLYHIKNAHARLSMHLKPTPLEINKRLSQKYKCNLFIKREDMQPCRSFKIRGAMNKLMTLQKGDESSETASETHPLRSGVVCSSSGNHAQGVAYSCSLLGIHGDVFVPTIITDQKLKSLEKYRDHITIHIKGDNFIKTFDYAKEFSSREQKPICHAFDDIDVIYGQGTIMEEITQEIRPDVIITGVGGGGLVSGILLHTIESRLPCQIIGVEPDTCPSMKEAFLARRPVNVPSVNEFVDGATIGQIGDYAFNICHQYLDKIVPASVNKVCKEMIDLYHDGIIAEPAGALPFAVLDILDNLEGKNVVCILSGGNNDIKRYGDIERRAQSCNSKNIDTFGI